jgi:c-di-GMP-binding flagellar brake protein YcgR
MTRLCDLAKLGEIVEIKVPTGNARTKVQEFFGEDEFTVFHPVVNGVSMYFDRDKSYSFIFYRSNGIYAFDAKIVRSYTKDDIKLCRLKQVSGVRRHQRRNAYRIPAIFDVDIECSLDENGDETEVIKAKTLVISEKSIQLICHAHMSENTKVTVRLYIDEAELLELNAEVFKCIPPSGIGDPYEIVLCFVDCTDRAIKRMRQLTISQQVKRYKGYIQR